MNGTTSMALVPVPAAPEPATRTTGCGSRRSFSSRTRWLVIAALLLAVTGLALGSGVLSLAAILPLLYVLPCLLMMGVCMKSHGKGGSSNDSNSA